MGPLLSQLSVITIILSGMALVVGVLLIKRDLRVWHMRAMLLASGLATLFLVLYLWRIGIGYGKTYVGPDEWRGAYFTLLISHTILAAFNLPLAVLAVLNAWKGLRAAGDLQQIDSPQARPYFQQHRAWVRWTVPVWLYVAATGWIIYLVLEHHGAVKGA
ncbi:DUF420 domain-containing protein [Deinococcus peraridilitoris]|uniref:Putative membrane protein n=1 Tax=Deinococcus peraridilitoris (strain DSM 19664 / LMG 22246 / CIP 109416 / KR-200) TaxID=937777 RepID=K9ZWX9_DEIPD|nr:DUF420 domain-containing protein [Deinococcus peraridilitoris]AFZ66138.1 putative membrane protein [Deinococcus peraridilitoris DSM 19664]